MCCPTLKCHDPLATTFIESCITSSLINDTIVLSEAFNYTETVSGAEEAPCIGANLVGGVVLNFSAITLFSISYISSTSTTLPINPIFNQDNLIYFQTLVVGDRIQVNDINNVNNYGVYEITNINPVLGPNATYRFTVTFLEGSGTFGSIGRTYSDCEQYTVQFSKVTPVPNFTSTIYQLNTPGEEEVFCAEDFTECDFVNSITVPCGDYEYPIGGVFVDSLVYWDSGTEEYTSTPTDFFVGVILKDNTETLISITADCDITLCFLRPDTINTEVSSYLTILNTIKTAQVLKTKNIVKKLTFGYDCSKDFVNLKKINDIISILDNYDTRDIVLGETVFNSISYEEIKLLINKIK